jgi:hypothetical protein
MRRAAVFKWWKRFRDGETKVKDEPRLFHYHPEACGKRSAARFREMGGALQEVHRLPREVLRKRAMVQYHVPLYRTSYFMVVYTLTHSVVQSTFAELCVCVHLDFCGISQV